MITHCSAIGLVFLLPMYFSVNLLQLFSWSNPFILLTIIIVASRCKSCLLVKIWNTFKATEVWQHIFHVPLLLPKKIHLAYLGHLAYENQGFILACYKKSAYLKGASSHTSTEAGLQNGECFKKRLGNTLLSSLAMNLEILLLTGVYFKNSKG